MLKRARFWGAAGLLAVSILATSSCSSASLRRSWLGGRTTSRMGCAGQIERHMHLQARPHAGAREPAGACVLQDTRSADSADRWLRTGANSASSVAGEASGAAAAAPPLSLAPFFFDACWLTGAWCCWECGGTCSATAHPLRPQQRTQRVRLCCVARASGGAPWRPAGLAGWKMVPW
jgi:hypothetical protein